MRRLPHLLLCAALLLLVPACKSPDSPKLVGKWQVVSAPEVPPDVTETWEFKSDGTVSLTAVALGGPPVTAFTGQYRLDFMNRLHIDHLDKPVGGANELATNVSFSGDQLTLKDDNGSVSTLK